MAKVTKQLEIVFNTNAGKKGKITISNPIENPSPDLIKTCANNVVASGATNFVKAVSARLVDKTVTDIK